MRNYSADVLHKLQQSIDEGKIEIKHFNNEDELPKVIYLDGIKVVFTKNNGTNDIVKYADTGFANTDNNTWKNTSLFKYYRKDWKKNNINLENYIEVKINVGELVIIGFLTKLHMPEQVINDEGIEVITPELTQFNEDSDLIINDNAYAIIKLYIDEYEGYSQNSQLEDRNYIEDIKEFLSNIDNNDEEVENDEDSMNSEVLF